MEQDYKKEIIMLRNKANEFQQINDKLILENTRLKNTIKLNEDDYESERTRLTRENKKSLQTIV